MKTARSLNGLVALAGLWEVLAPFILGYSTITVIMWNAIIVGGVLIILAAWAAFSEQDRLEQNLDWIIAVVGMWLTLAPAALFYSTRTVAMWNDTIIGVIVILLALWAATTFDRPVTPQM
jgi:hypothetical protein